MKKLKRVTRQGGKCPICEEKKPNMEVMLSVAYNGEIVGEELICTECVAAATDYAGPNTLLNFGKFLKTHYRDKKTGQWKPLLGKYVEISTLTK